MTNARRTATVAFSVPFCDVDAMQVVWHGNYSSTSTLPATACSATLASISTTWPSRSGVVFPITRTQTKHVRPLRFRDEVECTAVLIEFECRLVMDFEIRLARSGQLCAKGRTEQAAVRLPEGNLELRIPEPIRQALSTAGHVG
jgi:acyl-CoA thioester hydrolase